MATYALTIGGVSKELLHQTLSISESNNGRNVASFDVLSLDGAYSPAMGAEVVLTEDGTRIFGGHVDTPSMAGFGGFGLTGIVTKVSCVDFNALPDRRYVFATIAPGTLKAALQALVPYLTPYGVTLDAAQVVGPTLPELIYDYKRLDAVLNELSALTGYVWEVDYNKVLRMFLPGSTPAPFNVVTGDGNALGDITVEPTRTDYANRIIVRFNTAAIPAYAFLNTTANYANAETVVIGSATYTFDTTLTATAGHVLIGATAYNSLYNLLNAITGNTGSGTLYAAATAVNTQVVAVEQSSTQLRITAQATGTSGNSIGVSETALNASWITEGGGVTSTLAFGADKTLSGTATANNTAEQTANGLIERVYAMEDVYAFDVAQAYANAYLVRAVASPKRVSYPTDRTGIKPGMTQTITASTRGLSGTFTITDIRTSNPTGNRVERRVAAIGGTKLQETWKDTIKAWSGGGSSSTSVSGGSIVTSTSGIDGGGTAGTLAKWTAATTLGNSIVTESGTTLSVAGTVAATTLTGAVSATTLAATGATTLASVTATVLTVTGNGTFSGSVVPSSSATWDVGTASARWLGIYGVTGNLSGALTVSGAATLGAGLTVTGTVTATTLTSTGATNVGGTLSVSGSVVPTSAAVWTVGTTSVRWLAVYGVEGNFSGALAANTGAFSGVVTGATYNGQTISATASLTGTLAVSGATTLSTLTVTGATALNSTLAVAGITTFATHANPSVNYTSNLGSLTIKYKELHAAELWVETLVAQSTQATIGGRILVGPTTKLVAYLSATNTQIEVQHNSLASGDRVRLEAAGNLEWLYITSAPSGVGPYTYTVNRNVDGSGANTWSAGTAVFNTGTVGKGFIDLYSIGGVFSGVGPAIVGNVRTGVDFNAIEPRWAIGNLNGVYGYASETYGAAFGVPTGAWIKIDPTNGVRIGHNTTTKITLDSAGNASFTGAVTASSGTIGGWAISAASLTGGAGVARFDSTGTIHLGSGDDTIILSAESATYRLWIGKTADPANAPVRITKTGVITLGTGGSLNAGGVTFDAAGLYISPVSAAGGGVYANANAVRWTTDATSRTAIWRSDSTGLNPNVIWNFDNIGPIATYETRTNLLTKNYNFGTGLPWASAVFQAKARGSQASLELFVEHNLSGSGAGYLRPILQMYNASSGLPTVSRVVLGVGSFATGTSLGGAGVSYGLEIDHSGIGMFGTTSITGSLTTSSTIKERGRTIPIGEWTTRTYAAGNYSSDIGVWTVTAVDVVTEAWTLVGKTMTFAGYYDTTDISGGPLTLLIALPAGYVAAKTMITASRISDNGTVRFGSVYVVAGGSSITLLANAAIATWAASVGNTLVQFIISFEVQ